MALPVTFLTDYGDADEFAGACRAVLAQLAPESRVVDISHAIPPGDVRRGALALAAAAPYAGRAVHLAVVDPGVGTDRRAVVIETADGSYVVGPDNGLLSLAADELGGAVAAFDVSGTALALDPPAPTFHGRDVFAPVAAHLACERPAEVAGQPIDPASLEKLHLPEARVEDGVVVASVLYADNFGNLVLSARQDETPSAFTPAQRLSIVATDGDGGSHSAVRGRTFADGGGGLVVYDDSAKRLAIALDGGSATERLALDRDDEVRISVAP